MPNSGDSQKSGKITLGLKDNTGDPQVLFFAVNFDKTALSGFTAKGATFEQLINKFTYNAKPHTTTDTWTNGSLPMFAKGTFTLNHSAGAVPTATVQSSNGLTDGKIHFVRSIARVDVGINVSGTQFDETANAIATQPNLVKGCTLLQPKEQKLHLPLCHRVPQGRLHVPWLHHP